MQHFDGARLSPNSVRNAVWHVLNEPACQYLRTRNPRCSTVYIDNSLGPLARDSLCIKGKNWGRGFCLYIKREVYSCDILQNNGMIKYESINFLKLNSLHCAGDVSNTSSEINMHNSLSSVFTHTCYVSVKTYVLFF